MRRPVLVLLATWIAAASFTIVACSSFSEAEGTADDAGPPEAASSDVVVASDVADPADSGVRFCDLHADAELCADFDEGRPFDTGFTFHQGAIALDLDASFSPPSSLRMMGGPESAAVQYGSGSPPAGTTVQHLELDVLLEGYPTATTDPAVVAFAGILPTGDGCSFTLEYLTSGTRLDVVRTEDGGQTYDNLQFKAHVSLGKWSHIELTIAASSQGHLSASARIDGVTALDPTETGCTAVPPQPVVSLGLYANTPAAVHNDDVLFERR